MPSATAKGPTEPAAAPATAPSSQATATFFPAWPAASAGRYTSAPFTSALAHGTVAMTESSAVSTSVNAPVHPAVLTGASKDTTATPSELSAAPGATSFAVGVGAGPVPTPAQANLLASVMVPQPK